MGSNGIDRWAIRMAEHKRRGDHIIRYPKIDSYENESEKEIRQKDTEQELFLKEQRVKFWEKHHSIPTDHDLIWWGVEADYRNIRQRMMKLG